ncbi:MAG: outer membrane protein assembly factor BamD [Bdellovibrionales bacterium]|nr:outer membrane protein assembly factor BamD [Bdellovibrionales bacterium]
MLPNLSKRLLHMALFGILVGCASPPPEVNVAPYEAEIERLNQMVGEQQEQMDRLSASVEALQALSAPAKDKKLKAPGAAEEPKTGPATTALVKPDARPAKNSPRKDAMAELYMRGLQFYEAKEYGETLAVMNRFLKLAPTHVYADRAQYLLVDAYYQNAEYSMVLQESKDFEAKYPYSFRLPDVLYKRGLAYLKMGQKEYAASHFDQLVKRFPETELAAASKELLQQPAPDAAVQ